MKTALRVGVAFLSALLGVALCLALIRVDEAMHLLPDLPTPGGESDFSARATGFFGFVCPAFAALGAYFGWLAVPDVARALRAWVGAALGSIAAFGMALALGKPLRALSRTSLGGNGVFFLVLFTWVLFATLFAVGFSRRGAVAARG